jgi:hypothetical protein
MLRSQTPEKPSQSSTDLASPSSPLIRTLVTDSMLPTMDTPSTQSQLFKNWQQLLITDIERLKIKAENEELRREVSSLKALLDIKDSENHNLSQDLKSEKVKKNELVNKTKVIDKQTKQLSEKEKEIEKLKHEIGDVNERLNIAITQIDEYQDSLPNIPIQNRFSILGDNDNGNDIILFRGGWDPLSTIHMEPMRRYGLVFPSSEHLYHYEKALFLKDYNAAESIRKAPNPGESKRLAYRYFKQGTPDWHKCKFR